MQDANPVLEEISEEMKDQLVIANHDIDSENPNFPTKFSIRGRAITLLLFKDGKLKATKVGSTTLKSDVVSWIKGNI
jgi:thiol-disulfide isomerase/thioredoxin